MKVGAVSWTVTRCTCQGRDFYHGLTRRQQPVLALAAAVPRPPGVAQPLCM